MRTTIEPDGPTAVHRYQEKGGRATTQVVRLVWEAAYRTKPSRPTVAIGGSWTIWTSQVRPSVVTVAAAWTIRIVPLHN